MITIKFHTNVKSKGHDELIYRSYNFQMTKLQCWLVDLWCLMPLFTIFQLYGGGFIGGGNRNTRRKPPTCHTTTGRVKYVFNAYPYETSFIEHL